MGEQADLAALRSQSIDCGDWNENLESHPSQIDMDPIGANGLQAALDSNDHPLSFRAGQNLPVEGLIRLALDEMTEADRQGVGGIGLGNLFQAQGRGDAALHLFLGGRAVIRDGTLDLGRAVAEKRNALAGGADEHHRLRLATANAGPAKRLSPLPTKGSSTAMTSGWNMLIMLRTWVYIW